MEFIENLPCRGYFTKIFDETNEVQEIPTIKTYIATHDTTPPANQIITTDPTSILIRSLFMKKKKALNQKLTTTEITTKSKTREPMPNSLKDGHAETMKESGNKLGVKANEEANATAGIGANAIAPQITSKKFTRMGAELHKGVEESTKEQHRIISSNSENLFQNDAPVQPRSKRTKRKAEETNPKSETWQENIDNEVETEAVQCLSPNRKSSLKRVKKS